MKNLQEYKTFNEGFEAAKTDYNEGWINKARFSCSETLRNNLIFNVGASEDYIKGYIKFGESLQ